MKFKLVLLILLFTISASAQDVIVKRNGSTILCRIVEVNSTEIIYKKWSDLNGSNYVMERTDATSINYENGKRDTLSEPGINQYAPNNQNQGIQQMNDNALLNISNIELHTKKAKKHKIIGWTGGIILVGAGAAIFFSDPEHDDDIATALGIGGMATGIIWTGALLYSSKQYQKRANSLLSNTPIIQNEFKLGKGKSLIAGIDLLKENINHTNNIGIALRYNF